MSGNPPADAGGHLDVLPGWCYLNLLPGLDETFDARMMEGLRCFVDEVLGDHPHQFCAGDQWAVVAVGPPDAHEAERRLRHEFSIRLHAIDEAWEDDATAN